MPINETYQALALFGTFLFAMGVCALHQRYTEVKKLKQKRKSTLGVYNHE